MTHIISSRRGSALIIGLIIAVLLTIMATSFLEKILNLGQTSWGINNSAQAYSLATGLIEEQLMDPLMTKAEPWNMPPASEGSATSDTGRTLVVNTGGVNLPNLGKWNSPFDSDWNIIGMGEPVQIVIPDGIPNWNPDVKFYFRVPKISGQWSTGALASISNSGIILWTFWYSGASLYASGETEIFVGSEIDSGFHYLALKEGFTNTGTASTFQDFYTNYWSNCVNYQCTLKLSMIRPFLTNDSSNPQSFSFLEYRIEFPTGMNIPSQYMIIDSTSYVYGYLRSRQVRIPQITTSTATDFAVLQ
jgi:hypothetical protein